MSPLTFLDRDSVHPAPRTLSAERVRSAVLSMVQLRWIAVVSVVGVIWISDFFFQAIASPAPLYWTAAIMAVVNLAFHLTIRPLAKAPRRVTEYHAYLQIAWDICSLTMLAHLAGGVENPFLLYLVFHVVLASILMGETQTYLVATAACAAVFGLFFVEEFSLVQHNHLLLLPSHVPLATGTGLGSYHAGFCVALATTFIVTAFLSNSIMHKVRREKQRAAEASRRLEAILENMSEGVIFVGPDDELAFANAASVRMGHVRRSASAPTRKDLAPDVQRAIRGFHIRGSLSDSEELARGDRVFHTSYAQVLSPKHELEGTVLLSQDVTDRRRQEKRILDQNKQLRETQEEIRASREDLARATEKISDLIDAAARDQSFEVRFSNPHLVACWKVKSCGRRDCPCYGREPLRCWQVEGTLCDQGRRCTFEEKVMTCPSCEAFKQSCPDRLTELAEGFNNMMFILSRKADELTRLRYHAIQQERMATIGQMSAGIAHEIGNPLASIFSLLQVLKAATKDKTALDRLDLMRQSIERISKTVRQIVDFGRPIASEEWSYGDVEKIVLDTLRILQYDRRARQVEIATHFDRDLPKTMVIEHQLQQVFVNVTLNALQAMDGKGALTVRGYQRNGTIEVAISDTGTGMAPEQIQRAFEPFYTTKAAQKGTGLGLALSYNIVHKHGGMIQVQSESGKGSTFIVSLPLRTPDGG